MQRSTYISFAFLAFGMILLTFIVRGTTRLVLGDRIGAVLSLPFALVAGGLLVALLLVGILDRTGLWSLEDDLPR